MGSFRHSRRVVGSYPRWSSEGGPGLHIDVPLLVLISARSDLSATWKPSMKTADTVLDVDRLARAAVNLGRHLTLVRVRGGLHDVVLSAPSVRAGVFAEMERWVDAYLA